MVDLSLSPLQLVLLGTALELGVLVSESPTGAVADVYSRKWFQVISWVVMGLASMALPLTRVLAVLLVCQAVWGFGYTFQSGADTAWVTDEIGVEDDRLIMRRAIWRLVGVLIGLGVAVAVMATSVLSIEATMVASGAAMVAFGLVLAVVMTEQTRSRAFTSAPAEARSGSGAATAVAQTWRRGLNLMATAPVLRLIIVATVAMSVADETIDRLDLLRLVDLGLPSVDGRATAVWFGLAWMALTVISIPVMVWINRRDLQGSNPATGRTVAALMLLAGFGALALAGGWLALALVGWGGRDVIREVTEPLVEGWVNRQADSSIRATALSFHSQAMAAGEIGGGLALGALAELVPLALVFVVAGAAYFAAGGAALVARSR